METLSTILFILSPFALVCSRTVPGIVLAPILFVIGLICRWAGKKANEPPTIKVPNNKLWEVVYCQSLLSAEEEAARKCPPVCRGDEAARKWATTVCRAQNAWVPPESQQETIAKSVIGTTYKEQQRKTKEWFKAYRAEREEETRNAARIQQEAIDSLHEMGRQWREDMMVKWKEARDREAREWQE